MEQKLFFSYGEAEIEHLKRRDPKLGAAIERIGMLERAVNPNLFESLINSVSAQQISGKAHAAIWARLCGRFSPLTPEALAEAPIEELQRCGLSGRKAAYIQEIARAVNEGEVDLEALAAMPDAEVCAELVKLKGVGKWTAEMLLIFSLARPDVVSFGDAGIQRGMRMLYRHRRITPDLFEKYRRRYSPYGTVASLYLWAIAGGAIPELTDPAQRGPRPKK